MIDVLRSEWTKIRSVRSTMWTLGTAGVLMLAFGALMAVVVSGQSGGMEGLEPAGMSLTGLPFASLALATLGVLVISGEYRSGAIRTTLAAVPNRLELLTAKVVVFAAVALVVSTVASFGAFFVSQAVFAREGLSVALTEPGVFRAVVGAGLYLTASGLFGLALGALIRHTPGAIVMVIALILVLPSQTAMLPGEWGPFVHEHFTSNAGMRITDVNPVGGLPPWQGFAVYLGWIAVTLVAAAVLLKKRDA
ncbi:ABC transporter permease subunit [Nonomuraea sp. NPDC049152]|uniref:ABC transporter permease subunit n=1 Tax=Nonomuraea sp. NPDC049152 TaxID=3154350 RepID=UPI0033CF0C32